MSETRHALIRWEQRNERKSNGTWRELWSPTNRHCLTTGRPPTARGLVPPTPRQNVATPSHEEGSICILGERELRMRLTRRTFCTEGSACGCREGRDIYSLRSPRDSFQNFHPYYRGTNCSALEGSTGCIRNCFPPHVIRFRPMKCILSLQHETT
jgi:hypothetical protein